MSNYPPVYFSAVNLRVRKGHVLVDVLTLTNDQSQIGLSLTNDKRVINYLTHVNVTHKQARGGWYVKV